jgi:hypothetical protein
MAQLMINLPQKLIELALAESSSLYTMVFSNAAMCLVPLRFNGVDQHETIGSFFFSNVPGEGCTFTMTLCTIGKNMGVAIFADENSMPYPEKFLALYKRKYEEVMNQLETSK